MHQFTNAMIYIPLWIDFNPAMFYILLFIPQIYIPLWIDFNATNLAKEIDEM